MYVCQCKVVTDRQIEAAVAEGCTSVRQVAALTGAGTACGGCVPTLRNMVCGSCPSLVTELPCDDAPVGEPVRAQLRTRGELTVTAGEAVRA
ncbi:MAG: (2Fe-2S)-binding protein [Actinomycetota bacterium]|jgi:bacterioferritin-associated ferredoxin|uniref:(2Fe-2S)-binding protein n=1 Tax=Euzebya pacifica TaxID=1608957 RepID=UPI0030FA7192